METEAERRGHVRSGQEVDETFILEMLVYK